MKNWLDDFEKFLIINEVIPEIETKRVKRKRKSIVGKLYAGNNSLNGIIDVAMIASFGKGDDRTGILYRLGTAVDVIQVENIENDETHVKCIINGHTYIVLKPEELERMSAADIGTVNKDELVDIRNVEVKNASFPLEYIVSYLDQIKNLYYCMVGDCMVKSESQILEENLSTIDETNNKFL